MTAAARCRSWVLGCIVASAVGCAGSGHQDARYPVDVAVAEPENGTTVALTAGQTLGVVLRSLGDGGYQNWVLATAPDPAVLTLVLARHEPPRGPLPGDFGDDLFAFEAVAAGATRLVATATRTWSGETQTYALGVVVR